jgi:hypothetical protein
MPSVVIYNPVCGNGTAKSLFHEYVLPLLIARNHSPDKVLDTHFAGHAGALVVEHLQFVDSEETLTVILGSGDGTLHEIVDALAGVPSPSIHFVLVPCGTANALYSSLFPPTTSGEEETILYKLRAVASYLTKPNLVPLTLGKATFTSPGQKSTSTMSAVVISTAAHASILRESESLRDEIPGIERFKVAAQRNLVTWFNSSVKLLPASGATTVQIYDPERKIFVNHPESRGSDLAVHLEGPFSYFLATVNVDRLEPAFRITPLASTHPPTEPSFDIVVVRPKRDPSLQLDDEKGRIAFAAKATTIYHTAYRDGAHVNLRYDKGGAIVTEGDGPTVVEYIRCGAWEWVPVSSFLTEWFEC